MKLNWSVLKDTKWVVFQLTSFLMAIVGFILAVIENTFWVPFIPR